MKTRIESPAGCAIISAPIVIFGSAAIAGSFFGSENAWIGAVAPIIGFVAIGLIGTVIESIKR